MSTVSSIYLTDPNVLGSYYDQDDLNRIVSQLQANIGKISSLITTTRIGQAVFAFDASVDPAAQVGQPVFFSVANSRFEQSKLSLLVGPGGRTYASESSEAWGIISEKCAGDRAHILISGVASIDLTASVGTAAPAGKHYLTEAAGRLSSTIKHPLVVPVLLATGSGDVIFRPWFAETFPRYTPAKIELSTAPAGTAVASGGVSSIASPSALSLGWLPASHSVFAGKAPLGAKFGYNWKQDAQLKYGWPPINPSESRVYFEVGGAKSVGAEVLLSDGIRLTINADGIWWMLDSVTQTPWTYLADGATTGTRPYPLPRKMYLETDLTAQGTELLTGVTSLSTKIPWLEVLGRGTSNAASIGDLQLAIDDSKLYTELVSDDGVVLKSLLEGKFVRGTAVSSLRSASPAITLSGQQDSSGQFIGPVLMQFAGSKEFDLLPIDTQLFNATTEAYGDLMALGLPPGRTSSFVCSFHVPTSVPANSNLKFILWLSGGQTYSVPSSLSLTSRVFGRPTAATAIPTENALALTIPSGLSVPVGKYVEVSSANVVVSGGDTVYLRVARAGASDSVGTEIHVLKQFAVFVN